MLAVKDGAPPKRRWRRIAPIFDSLSTARLALVPVAGNPARTCYGEFVMRAYKNVVATINAQLAREAADNGYLSAGPTCTDDDVLALARKILDRRIRQGDVLDSPAAVRDYLRVHLATLEHEEFHALFVDVQNRLICHVPLFRGTLTQTSVYPREVLKTALQCNAAAVLFAHNHPSGTAQPSQDDRALTARLRNALELIGVRVLDHFIVAGASGFSFAESGLL